MTKKEKLLEKFLSNPTDLTWEEFSKVLAHYGYVEHKGKGSRRKFVNKEKEVIIAHKPHPRNVVKKYIIDQVIEKLNLR